MTLDEARRQAFHGDWQDYTPPRPRLLATGRFDDYPLDVIAQCIDWSPFFHTWELAGRYPAILDDEVVGEQARQLYRDARAMLDTLIRENWLTARAVYGLFPANSAGDDILIYSDDSRSEVRATLHHLRQQHRKEPGQHNFCLADYVAPVGTPDYVGAFAVTAGQGIEAHLERFAADHDDYSSILLKALADRLAEAFAEHLHERVRTEFWGYAPDENLSNEQLAAEDYRGIRPAPGYPACPDHTEKETLFKLLDATRNTGITLTESYAMYPASSVSGWYFSHPASRYFNVGKIGRDQVEEYASRKKMEFKEMEKWLGPNLAYEPE
jgi:5-methyltetrahydrofolate--homocysteine methyltransferase